MSEQTKPAPCEHDWECVGDEGDFSTGQEFDVYKCKKCGKRKYAEVPQ